jgi:hypothetical protein
MYYELRKIRESVSKLARSDIDRPSRTSVTSSMVLNGTERVRILVMLH